jgi:hypothetical protein
MFKPLYLSSALTVGLLCSGAANAEIDPMGHLSSLANDVSDSTDGVINVSGYVNGHIMIHDGTPTLVGKNLDEPLYQLREASLFVDAVINDSLLFSTELEMSYDFSDKENSGRESRFEALFNYYYLDLDLSNAMDWDTDENGSFKVRAGRILVPFLQHNENKPSFKQSLMSAPFTAWQIVPTNNTAVSFKQFGWTDLGLSFNYSKVIGDAGLVDVKLSIINGLGTDSQVLDSNTVQLDPGGVMKPTVRPRDGLANAKSDWDEFSDVNDEKSVVLKVSYVPFSIPVNVGFSYYKGAWDKAENHDLTMKGFHASYSAKDWGLKGEYLIVDVEQTAGINVVTAAGPGALNSSTGDYEMSAWYVEGSYTPVRYDNDKFLKVILRFDEVDTNDQAAFTPFDRSRVTLGLEWRFLNNMRLRLEQQESSISDFEKAPGPFVDAGGAEDISMTMMSLIAYF